MCIEFFSAIVRLETGAYLDGVWSIFMITEDGIWCFSFNVVIWWWNISSASFRAPAGISGLEVVHTLLTKPIRLKRLFAHEEESRSINCRCSSSLFDISALAVALSPTVLTTPPFFS